MLIYFAIQCHLYELRFRWQWSSLLQQINAPDMIVDCAILDEDYASRALLPPVISSRPGLELRYHPAPREIFTFRGLNRNLQLARAYASGADWIYFADCDTTYHPHFFAALKQHLETDFANTTNCITAINKIHTEKLATDKAVGTTTGRRWWIRRAHERALALPRIVKLNRWVAAGCMQVVRADMAKKKVGVHYAWKGKNRDRDMFAVGQGMRSDLRFRSEMGGCSFILDLPDQVHLDHIRDKDLKLGKHDWSQR